MPAKAARPKQQMQSHEAWLVIIVAGILAVTLLKFGCGGTGAPKSSDPWKSGGPATVAHTSPEPPAPKPLLRMRHADFHWHEEAGFAIAEGKVTNISSGPLDEVEAVVDFLAADGSHITSASALVEYQPILAGQGSPFRVMATWNPAMKKGTADVQFKYLMGGTILTDFPAASATAPKGHSRKGR